MVESREGGRAKVIREQLRYDFSPRSKKAQGPAENIRKRKKFRLRRGVEKIGGNRG